MFVSETPRIELIHGDCMPALEAMKENQFDLAIVDPPYFDGPQRKLYYGSRVKGKHSGWGKYSKLNNWQVPDNDYWVMVKRCSKEQIVWGINYFDFSNVGPGRIIWDKCNEASTFSDCEIAYCSKIFTVRKFTFMWNGMMQGKSLTEGQIMNGRKSENEKRIHQTQKPVILYKWLLKEFAKPGQRILDTHGGSMSIAIACYDMGIDLDLYEIDEECYNRGIKRFNEHKSQMKLFK